MTACSLQNYSKLAQAMSDEKRLRILSLLRDHELCHCELQPVLGIAASTLSQHMRILMDAGLVQQRQEGKWRFFSLMAKPDPVQKDLLKSLKKHLADHQIEIDESALGCVACGPKGKCDE